MEKRNLNDDERNMRMNSSEMDNVTKVILVILIVVFVGAIIIVKFL